MRSARPRCRLDSAQAHTSLGAARSGSTSLTTDTLITQMQLREQCSIHIRKSKWQSWKNPLLSMWLSGANAVAGKARSAA